MGSKVSERGKREARQETSEQRVLHELERKRPNELSELIQIAKWIQAGPEPSLAKEAFAVQSEKRKGGERERRRRRRRARRWESVRGWL